MRFVKIRGNSRFIFFIGPKLLTSLGFPHYAADGTFVIRDVTLGELLDAIGTEFRGYGISNSGYLEVYIESSSTYSPQDLLNVYNLIQETAFMNGYDTAVPVLFLQPAASCVSSGDVRSVFCCDVCGRTGMLGSDCGMDRRMVGRQAEGNENSSFSSEEMKTLIEKNLTWPTFLSLHISRQPADFCKKWDVFLPKLCYAEAGIIVGPVPDERLAIIPVIWL